MRIRLCMASDDGRLGTSFMTWWRPSWRDVWCLLRGDVIRVTVNYSLYGPLDLDVVKKDGLGAGMPGRTPEW